MNRTRTSLLRRVAVLALVLGVPACGSAPQSGPVTPSPAYDPTSTPLRPGDALRLTFWLEPTLSGEYAVDESGAVVLPLLGSRVVAAVSAAELKRQLQADYAKEIQNQEVAIVLLRRVRVLGAVQEPGLYFIDPTMTLGDVVALAGGVTATGKQDEVRVFQAGHEVGSDLSLGELAVRHLASGDGVVVPERSWFSRYGAVVVGAFITATGIIVAAVVNN